MASSYHYEVTPSDLHLEQQAFEPGEGVKECFILIGGFGGGGGAFQAHAPPSPPPPPSFGPDLGVVHRKMNMQV